MINLEKVSFYRADKLIIDDFDGQLNSGELVLLTGANGAGKSTLIQLIAGVLKPNGGRITFNGKDLSEINCKDQALLRSVCPQRRDFHLAFKVKELIELLPAQRRSFALQNIIEALELDKLMHLPVIQLSLGEQQRVSLAIALVQESNFYLLDEPFSAQDSQSIIRIIKLLKSIANEKGVLVISHSAENLHSYFDREIKLS
ncbi:MAG: ATP-binding cassette domain-containing protein [Actinobacteria bacterium]|nr:ATP-binding cassette domain-containing protein [Actinomycetota bacterium]